MLRAFTDLRGMTLGAVDGEIGSVKDAYFDDSEWTLRYLVAATGGWLSGRDVLLSPRAIRGVDWLSRRIDFDLTRKQIENAPSPESDRPVSRQYEARYHDHFGYSYYWATTSGLDAVGFGGLTAAPPVMDLPERQIEAAQMQARQEDDPHLRSAKEVAGYAIDAADGLLGHVDDFLFEDSHWRLRFFVVDTRRWLPGRQVLISTDWIESVDWESRSVGVTMTKEEVRHSPEYSPAKFTEADETALYEHYGRSRPGGPRVQIR